MPPSTRGLSSSSVRAGKPPLPLLADFKRGTSPTYGIQHMSPDTPAEMFPKTLILSCCSLFFLRHSILHKSPRTHAGMFLKTKSIRCCSLLCLHNRALFLRQQETKMFLKTKIISCLSLLYLKNRALFLRQSPPFPLLLTSPETSGKPGTTAKGGSSKCCRGSRKALPVLKTTVCGVFSSTRKLTHFSMTSPTASRSLPRV